MVTEQHSNMNRIFCLAFLVALVGAQQYGGDPRTAAILSEQRYQSNDGSFGAQYKQEDGVQFKEESLPDGSRKGTYSYVDPSGQTRTISYTAGKHGFIASGDGVPQPIPTVLPVAPQPQYKPLPQYNPPDYRPPQDEYNPPPQQYNPPPQQYNSRPQQYNPRPQEYNPPPPQYNPRPQQFEPAPQPQYNPPPQYEPTTPAPHRFYPPGKLSLNRSPDGYSYNFQSNV
ncbi:extensin [Agrilus planipennis]|uniref:Extensin n=1 Tax=Agrilus planipennis TaxID=224129 RepID=A0A1W4WI42_AGRPL|nr:extensin [Agrilus planipennis]